MQNDVQTLDTLQTPCLFLDEPRLRANVARMKSHLAGLGVAFRPHLKTAKSLDVARIAMTSPEPGMVSTLREAEYFAEGGVRDMVYGVGIAPGKLARVSAIRARASISPSSSTASNRRRPWPPTSETPAIAGPS